MAPCFLALGSHLLFELADADRFAGFGGEVGSEADGLGQGRVFEIGEGLLVLEDAIEEVGDFALERMMAEPPLPSDARPKAL